MIKEAVTHFKKGEVVIFPTDTLYGIGCTISNKEAISRIYKIRGDSADKPQLILAASPSQAFDYGLFDKRAKKLAEMFWPGPLTIVIKAKEKVPRIIRGPGGSIGIRVPDQLPILKIIGLLGEPILAPSANSRGVKPPTSFSEIDKTLLSLVDYAIEQEKLPNASKMQSRPSTVIDLTKSPYQIIRVGAVNLERLKAALEEPSK